MYWNQVQARKEKLDTNFLDEINYIANVMFDKLYEMIGLRKIQKKIL